MASAPALSVLLSAEQIGRRVAELAAEINRRYPPGRDPHLVVVLKGGVVFLADLIRALGRPLTLDLVALSSYGAARRSSGTVTVRMDLDDALVGRDVLIVEDIVDTGRTLAWLQEHIRRRGPRSVRTVALLDKPSRRRHPVVLDHVGFTIEDRFVVGYGLDLAERFRELPYVAVLPEPPAEPGRAQSAS